MNAISLRVLLGFFGCAGWAAADAPIDSPSRKILESYSYDAPLLVGKSASYPGDTASALFVSQLAPGTPANEPRRYNFRAIAEAIASDKKQRAQALFTWTLIRHEQLQVLVKPTVQILNVPWTPMTTADQPPLSPSEATRRLQVGFPLVKLLW